MEKARRRAKTSRLPSTSSCDAPRWLLVGRNTADRNVGGGMGATRLGLEVDDEAEKVGAENQRGRERKSWG